MSEIDDLPEGFYVLTPEEFSSPYAPAFSEALTIATQAWPDAQFIIMEGYNDAIVGVALRPSGDPALVYDVDKVLAISQEALDMSLDEAEDWFYTNQLQAYLGASTPVFMRFTESL